MRIVAGTHRTRRLLGGGAKGIRPTVDRARESIFNALGQRCHGLRVMDLFSGTGALALEALSRGAHFALLVDNSVESVRLCKQNVSNLGFKAQSEIWHMDAFLALSRCKMEGKSFEWVFADPPYAFRNWEELWLKILEEEVLSPGGKMILERSKRCILPALPKAFSLQKEMKFGDTVVSILLHSAS
ncbi:MAG: 16S rRNA (guanine(966)-N(2))-methyltransferase RsmD [Cystobacterineae bacterium]|nr:16S rRNA (guanine(966)-N(2))-methyltransferase RsmD [Cystobacterineae bacterium]